MQEENKYIYDYPMFSVAVDIAIVDSKDNLLVIRRGGDVNTNCLALVGGFVDINETLKQAAVREVKEEIGFTLEEGDLFDGLILDDVDRDPRGRVISYQFTVYLEYPFESYIFQAGDDAASIEFHHLSEVPSLAFDHNKVAVFLRNIIIGGIEF